ncbi:E3 ubiquitin-protein ligase RNF19B-like [Bolinopsis microptera]|uniref:E3 ubiquitin-protein ligase RNF19B-like n=1 Tax=Bolinopsis microptera TaxID=2820187 RepID=UPI00307973B7
MTDRVASTTAEVASSASEGTADLMRNASQTSGTSTTEPMRNTVFNFLRKRKKSEKTGGRQYREYMCCVCLMNKVKYEFPKLLSCSHRTCEECLRLYFKTRISTGSTNITCPNPGCYGTYTPKHVKMVLRNDHLHNKYQEFMVRKVLSNEPDCRWCPTPDCGYAVIATGCAACPLLQCRKCNTEFCYHCKGLWHPNQTCDDARKQMNPHPIFLASNDTGTTEVVKKCPRCMAHVTKMDDGSCNHMTCAVCGIEFCWLCLREVTDIHYLSPTGCTFWGKRTWSRKKRMLWQMGTLVGAPFGICLLSAVALPAIFIAVPAYVGRRLNLAWKRRHAPAGKRVIIVSCGVALASICSPVIAAVSVSVGVPMMIAFVYTVVPFLICRGESCLGNSDRVQLPNTMADLNEQLQGLQNQLNNHFHDRQSTSTDTHKGEPGEQAPSSIREDMGEITSSDDSSSCSDDTSDIYYSGSEKDREEEEEEGEEGEVEKAVISHTTAV